MRLPAVSAYMTANPYTIDRRATLAEARRVMQEHNIRHLPVLDRGDLCGVISDRDLRLYEGAGSNPDEALVNAAMSESPFIVTSDTALDEVVEIMGEQKYGSVVVMGHNGVEGIFTAVDACRALAEVLRAAA
ncbi:MAG: CBS domain-containing protein [Deltaproteobacteria bacterium]|nr:CBS domain-containing protein [Deltaproteobacteria bacterium]MCW5803631.1 CBS domain-containing protein [Deltaproteobacteria bacterium]